MSPAFIKGAVREPVSGNPERDTARTIQIMCGHIRTAAADPLVKAAADTALAQHGPIASALRGYAVDFSRLAAESIWWYCKHQVKFVHHQKQIEAWFGEHHHLQLLIAPDVLLRFPFRMEGDCAIYSMLICAMLQSLGLHWELCTVAWDPNQPDIFLHVYPRVMLADGSRLALDASHGDYPGWSIPAGRRIRTAAWSEDGSNVADSGEQRFGGLHGYGFLRRGFGDDGTDTTTLDLSSTPGFQSIDQPAINTDTSLQDYQALQASAAAGGIDTSTGLPVQTVTSSTGTSSTGYVAPSQSSAQWAAFATQLAKSGMTLAEINAIQPGTVVSPNGAILRQATGYPISGNPLSTLTNTLSGSSGSTILLWGGALVGLLVIGSLMSKR